VLSFSQEACNLSFLGGGRQYLCGTLILTFHSFLKGTGWGSFLFSPAVVFLCWVSPVSDERLGEEQHELLSCGLW
jgi:hypothetical protein